MNRWLSPAELAIEKVPAVIIAAYEFARKDAGNWMEKYYAVLKERRLLLEENANLRVQLETLGVQVTP